MGIIFPRQIGRLCSSFEETSARVLLVGLDSAGKSTLLARFKNLVELQTDQKSIFIERILTEPTFVYEVDTIHPPLAPLSLNIWDLGGQSRTRQLWRFYLTDIEGLIFVIDCHDADRLIVAREELLDLFQQLDSSGNISIIIAANKQDLTSSLKKDDLLRALALPNSQTNQWKCFEISAQTGFGVMEMFSYLSQSIHNRR